MNMKWGGGNAKKNIRFVVVLVGVDDDEPSGPNKRTFVC
jgi:hypothetical protein